METRSVLRSLGLLFLVLLASAVAAQLPPAPPPLSPRGLITNAPGVTPGYVLFSPILDTKVYLVDNEAKVVHTWDHPFTGLSHYLLPNGSLLRGARDPEYLQVRAGGVTGYLQEIDWDGNVVWQWKLGDDRRVLHHDIEPLPNGRILALGWEVKTREEAIAAGRRPEAIPDEGLLSEWVMEIEPIRPDGARIVWEWHVWDHLLQGADPAAEPGRLDPNAGIRAAPVSPEELAQLQALGYAPADATPQDLERDFLHANAIDYHPGLDQIAISLPELGEVWIIDHSTTTAEAAGSTGGRAGHGGDLLYRWGNPANYGRGPVSAKRLFYQHDVRWIPEGENGAGHLTVFNNGNGRPTEPPYSSVDEIAPPLLPDGTYGLEDGKPFGPEAAVGEVRLPPDHFAPFISGATRLPNGNTFACAGTDGLLIETDPSGKIVWEYRNPFTGNVRLADGSPPGPGIDERPYAVFRATRIPLDHPALSHLP